MTERPAPEEIERIRRQAAIVGGQWAMVVAEIDALRHELAAARLVRDMTEECKGCATAEREREHIMHDTAKAVAGAEAREEAAIARAVAAEQERDEQRQRAEEAEYGCEVLSVGDPYERLRDVREAGKTALRERDEARAKLVAAEQRAGIVELALAGLRGVVAAYLDDEDDDRAGTMDALIAARRATPTDLAEALRRELRATAFDEAVSMLEDDRRAAGAQANEPGMRDFTRAQAFDLLDEYLHDASNVLDKRAAELRGPK